MTVNLSRRQRVAIYLINIIGTPVVVYAIAKGWIGELELALWGAEVAAAMTLAGLNVASAQPAPAARATEAHWAEYERLYNARAKLAASTAQAAKGASTGERVTRRPDGDA